MRHPGQVRQDRLFGAGFGDLDRGFRHLAVLPSGRAAVGLG